MAVVCSPEKLMNILLVHAHPEPKSFSSALASRAREILTKAGHTVTVSDLYAMKFDPVSDRRNFSTTKDPDYYKQQQEETYATEHQGFSPLLEAEIQKLEAADALIFNYPLWWFGQPAILKGWVDRVFAYARIYGNGKLYENGLGQGTKRGLVLMTTGGGPDAYGGYGFNPSMETILKPVHHGIFWFNGFRPLAPFLAWSPAHGDDAFRHQYLEQLDAKLANLFTESPLELPPMADFPNYGKDSQKRFHVTISLNAVPDATFNEMVPKEKELVAELRRTGRILDFQMTATTESEWHAYAIFREPSREALDKTLATLPLFPYLNFDIRELAQN
jgi:NAD(P)H dehydrogenase (quinone)